MRDRRGAGHYNECFNGTLRHEVLNAEWFSTTGQAQAAINIWLKQYRQVRPHQALNMRPHVPEALLEKPQITGPNQEGSTFESCRGRHLNPVRPGASRPGFSRTRYARSRAPR
ncbi:integrase core domain-containing protein [Thalassobaculum sp.]|uniref:integrase core domain-containing protein n=1 Tax=Thalassobaculum sp. TaxID=2022740 RepID=UPI0032ECEBBA